MEIDIGRGKKGRRAYGFDDIAIVPSRRTRDPDDIDISWTLGPYRFDLPLVASAMDGVVSPDTAVLVNELGGLGVLNLEGIWARYENAEEQLEKIAAAVTRFETPAPEVGAVVRTEDGVGASCDAIEEAALAPRAPGSGN